MKISNKQKNNFIKSLKQVGDYLLEKRSRFLNRGNWNKGQFKNESDKIIDKLLKNKLTSILDVPILSEEKIVKINKKKNIYWLIDPIDGTASYANGYDGFVTQAALIKDNKPILEYTIVYYRTVMIKNHCSMCEYRVGCNNTHMIDSL